MSEEHVNARKDIRIAKELTVKFRSPGEESYQESISIDISRSGIFIRTEKVLPVDASLEIQLFTGESEDPLLFDATVTRITKSGEGDSGMAIKIEKIRDPENVKFNEFFDLLNNYGWFC